MSNSEQILMVEKNSSVVSLTLNRPQVRNALNQKLIAQLTQQLLNIKNDDTIRIIIIRGAGDHFCAGGDIKWLQESINYTEQQNLQDAQLLADLMHTLNSINKFTICVTQGSVYGGALGLVACCDLAIAHDKSVFCFSELKLGLSPAIISPYVINAIGIRAARRWMLSAEPFASDIAMSLGLVHKTFTHKPDDILEYFSKLIAQTGPKALQATKTLLLGNLDLTSKATEPTTTHLLAALRTSKEGQEGLQAFLQKRDPNW